MRRIASQAISLAMAISVGVAFNTGSANAWGAGGGGGGSGGAKIDNRTPGQRNQDKRSKDNPNKFKSKNPPARDPGLRPGNGPISNQPYSGGQNGGPHY